MTHIIGRGRYAREGYPLPKVGGPGGDGCSSDYCFDTVVEPAGTSPTGIALTQGGNFMFPNDQEVGPGPGTPIQVPTPPADGIVVAQGEALVVHYDLPAEYAVFSSPVNDPYNASFQFSVALFDVDAGTWNLMDGDYLANGTPFGNDVLQIFVPAEASFDPLAGLSSGRLLFRPPAGTYRVGLFGRLVSTTGTGNDGQIFFSGGSVGIPKLSAHKVAASCVIGAYDVSTLFPLTPGNVPWSNPA